MTSNYTVMAVTLLIWVALFIYLMMLNRKVKKLED
ncbi:MAG: CcmD family protein [Candidatus Zixiibacteriota bacterium]